MALATAVISYDIADMVGTDFDASRTKVWVSTNVPGDAVIDTVGNAIRLGDGKGTIAPNGTGSVSVWIPGSGSNPATWQTYVHVDYVPKRKGAQHTNRTFGPFTITATADLADLIAEQEVPPTYLSQVTAALDAAGAAAAVGTQAARAGAETARDGAVAARLGSEAARDEAEALVVSDLGTTDGQTRALIEAPTSQTALALAATIGEEVLPVASQVEGVTETPWLGTADVSLTSRFQAALARVKAATADAVVLVVGDSTDAGLGAGGPGPGGNSPAVNIARRIDRLVAPATYTGGQPPGEGAPGGIAFDPRWSMGAGWQMDSEYGMGGRGTFTSDGSVTSQPLTYTPGTLCDTFDVYYLSNTGSGLGHLALSVDGGAVVDVDCGALGYGIRKATVTCPLGSGHTLSIVKSIGTTFVAFVEARDSTRKTVRVINAGVCSSRAYAPAGQGYVGWGNPDDAGHSTGTIKAVAPDLTIIRLGINDAFIPPYSSLAQWEAAVRALIAAAQVSGDVVLASTVPSQNGGDAGDAIVRETEQRARLYAIAEDTGALPLDVFARFGNFALADQRGWMSDPIHLSATGSLAVADLHADVFTTPRSLPALAASFTGDESGDIDHAEGAFTATTPAITTTVDGCRPGDRLHILFDCAMYASGAGTNGYTRFAVGASVVPNSIQLAFHTAATVVLPFSKQSFYTLTDADITDGQATVTVQARTNGVGTIYIANTADIVPSLSVLNLGPAA